MTDLKTIDELMAGKKPGEIKITWKSWESNGWFQPFFRDSEGIWHGLDDDQDHHKGSCGISWKLYKEPKVKRWQWMLKRKGLPFITGCFHKDEDEICHEYNGVEILYRIDESMRLFDE